MAKAKTKTKTKQTRTTSFEEQVRTLGDRGFSKITISQVKQPARWCVSTTDGGKYGGGYLIFRDDLMEALTVCFAALRQDRGYECLKGPHDQGFWDELNRESDGLI